MKKVSLALSISLLAALPLTFNACDKGSLHKFNSVFGPANIIQSTGGGNPITGTGSENAKPMTIALSPFQPQSIEALTICVSRLRFRTASSSLFSDVRFNLGDVLISPLGTPLAGVKLPDGNYDEIEMELDDSCPSGKSVQLLRAGKSFSTSRFIQLSFSGRFTAQQAKVQLTLGLQQIINSLNSINSGDDIEGAIESQMESYQAD